jgi:hypothetical protein
MHYNTAIIKLEGAAWAANKHQLMTTVLAQAVESGKV